MNAYKIYKGKIDYTLDKIIINGITFLALIAFLLFDPNDKIPLIVCLTPVFVDIIIHIDLFIKERFSTIEIHPANNELIYNNISFFGLIRICKRFKCNEWDMNEILKYYKKDKEFSIDSVNKLIGSKVTFNNK
ncbi:hypothetical protein [Ornithinibacillus halophilus]|uniref:Uncharacterized protein n=1 Tax=Ornithinibacillus halophilus TaxID=930117 RepID=A0A1M5G1J1_9BACI|nr:hypothetical protein [Ornithinibacillus halophilus]SHF97697.1 hypothetical protein SAMN05216225_101130 [Ornithinibacillus halophilus]